MRFSTLWYLYGDLKIKALPDSSSSFLLFLREPQNLENKLPLFFSSAFFFFFLNAAASYDAKLKVNSYIFEKKAEWLFLSTVSRSSWNLEHWLLYREENWRSWIKTLGVMTKNNKKLNPQVIQGLGIAPRLQRYKTNPLTTAPSWLTLTLAFTMPLPT